MKKNIILSPLYLLIGISVFGFGEVLLYNLVDRFLMLFVLLEMIALFFIFMMIGYAIIHGMIFILRRKRKKYKQLKLL